MVKFNRVSAIIIAGIVLTVASIIFFQRRQINKLKEQCLSVQTAPPITEPELTQIVEKEIEFVKLVSKVDSLANSIKNIAIAQPKEIVVLKERVKQHIDTSKNALRRSLLEDAKKFEFLQP